MESLPRLVNLIDWRRLLIEHYKALFLDENDVMIILSIEDLLTRGMSVVTPDDLAHKMTLSHHDIDVHYTDLSTKGYIQLIELSSGHWMTSLSGIQHLLLSHFMVMNGRQDAVKKTDQQRSQEEGLYNLLEKELGHTLSSLEIDIIRSWFDLGYTPEKVNAAIHEALLSKVRNIHYIDKILLQWSQEEERTQEGYSAVSSSNRQTLGQSMQQSKTDWTSNDKKK